MAIINVDQHIGVPVVLPTIEPVTVTLALVNGAGLTIVANQLNAYRMLDRMVLNGYVEFSGTGSSGSVLQIEVSINGVKQVLLGNYYNQARFETSNGTIMNATALQSGGNIQFTTDPNNGVATAGVGVLFGSTTNSLYRYIYFKNAVIPNSTFSDNYRASGVGKANSSRDGLGAPRGDYKDIGGFVTGTGWTSTKCRGRYFQEQDGTHKVYLYLAGSVPSSARGSYTIAVSGLSFPTGSQACSGINSGAFACSAYANSATNTLSMSHASDTTTSYIWNGEFEVSSKPSWA